MSRLVSQLQRPRNPRGSPALAALVAAAAVACSQRGTGTGSTSTPSSLASASSTSAAPSGGPAAAPSSDACASLTAQQRALVVARVGDTSLTLCDFARRVNLQNQYLRARFNAPEQRRALLRAWVDSELLAAEARTRGLDREPAVHHAVTAALARQLESEVRSGVSAPAVSPDEVQRYYDAHRDEYDTPEQVRASHAVLANREAASRVLAQVREHPNDDAFWRDLVRRESTDAATRDQGGDLGFFSRDGGGSVAPEVAAAAFALRNPGDLAPSVVESAHGGPGRATGFHVVRFVARREALHRSLDEVRRAIENRLARERTDEAQDSAVRTLVERLRREAQVNVDEGALGQVRIDAAPGVAPAMTGPMPWLNPSARAVVPAAGASAGPASAAPPARASTAPPAR